MIVLTSDPSIPRNIVQIMKDHPKKMEMDKLSKYNLLREELKWANYHKDVKKIEELKQEFENQSDFYPRENVKEEELMHIRPDLQMIVNTKFYDKVNMWKALSQVTI